MKWRRYAGLAVLSALLLSGCASQREFTGPWAGEYKVVYESTDSEFVKKVIEDGEVTASEYRESQQRWLDCMDKTGFHAEILDGGGYLVDSGSLEKTDSDAADAAEGKCSREAGLSDIEALYGLEQSDPSAPNDTDFIIECLVEKSVISKKISGEDFNRGLSDGTIDTEDPAFAECMQEATSR